MRQKLGEKITLSVLDDRHNSPKKVSKFQNEFMKKSFLPRYEPNVVRISGSYFKEIGRETMTS